MKTGMIIALSTALSVFVAPATANPWDSDSNMYNYWDNTNRSDNRWATGQSRSGANDFDGSGEFGMTGRSKARGYGSTNNRFDSNNDWNNQWYNSNRYYGNDGYYNQGYYGNPGYNQPAAPRGYPSGNR